MQIAVYGKGGIGKSTMSANLSAALAACGSKVLQIGCDPKHDSTRLLHHGRKVVTILDYLLNTPEDEQKLDDVLMTGFLDTGCVEAGGPRPGMGCAGRGILTAFDFLNQFHAMEHYDQIVYDVLGDVVCGGFAVPRPGSRYLERFAVHIEVLFYGTPVVRIDQLRCLGSSVCIVYADYSIGNVALHVVGTSRHQQISM